MYTDMFHLYPTDGYVNNQRDNYPYGVTSSPTWTSTNGSRLGPSSYPGYTGIVFEPLNAYKGDLARTYFYMAVRYYGEDGSWPGSEMVTGSQPKTWALKMLLEWDIADPVSQKERDRNNAVYGIQGNRNPFIDNTAFANLIWGSQTGTEEPVLKDESVRIWPVPAVSIANIEIPQGSAGEYKIRIVDITGKVKMDKTASGSPVMLDVTGFENGYYILLITIKHKTTGLPLVVAH
jgi:hypothetical protein